MRFIKIDTSIVTLLLLLLMMNVNACASEKENSSPAQKKQAAQNTASEQTPALDTFFNTADAFLAENIEDGKVPYEAIAQEPAKLEELVAMIGNASLGDASDAEKKAFYINAYNILTIHSIIENNIPSSPMDVDGFFGKIKHNVAGKKMTLDEIEKGTLFPEFGDARVHFAVVCAATGCPQIQPEAYIPDKLNAQLDEAARESLNRDYFIRVNEDKKSVQISQLFDWYKKDFLKEADSVLAYINQYRDEGIPSDYSVGYYDYDWSLNSAR